MRFVLSNCGLILSSSPEDASGALGFVVAAGSGRAAQEGPRRLPLLKYISLAWRQLDRRRFNVSSVYLNSMLTETPVQSVCTQSVLRVLRSNKNVLEEFTRIRELIWL